MWCGGIYKWGNRPWKGAHRRVQKLVPIAQLLIVKGMQTWEQGKTNLKGDKEKKERASIRIKMRRTDCNRAEMESLSLL